MISKGTSHYNMINQYIFNYMRITDDIFYYMRITDSKEQEQLNEMFLFPKFLHNQALQHEKLCGGNKCLWFPPQDQPSKHATTQENHILNHI